MQRVMQYRRGFIGWLATSLLLVASCDTPPTQDDGSGGGTATGGGTSSAGLQTSGGTYATLTGSGLGGFAGSAGIATGGNSSGSTVEEAGPGQRMRDYLGDPTYPDDFWRAATPSEAQMDVQRLEQSLEFIQSNSWEIHAFLIARNGRLVFERYGWKSGSNPSDPDKTPHAMVPSERHAIFSVTKSITSALVGIAIEEGAISGVDHEVVDWFSDYAALNPSTEKSSITLADLLTMRSGLEFTEGESAVFDDEPNPARALLARDVVTAPGSTWNYSSGDSEIVAETLRITTGRSPLEYAQAQLFGPLGISDPPWNAGKSGTQHGGFGLSLTAREMARFGELYRNEGVWANQQVVPASWVIDSTSYKCASLWGMDYGYYWFLPQLQDFFVAIGFNGQQIFVSRSYGLVIVFLGDLPSSEANANYSRIITDYVVPAIQQP